MTNSECRNGFVRTPTCFRIEREFHLAVAELNIVRNFELRTSSFLARVLTFVLLVGSAGAARAVDVYGKRFDPPRVYFAHSSLNKSGVTSAIKGQANFIDIYMTPVDNTSARYTAEGFTWSALLPAFVRIPDAEDQGLKIEATEYHERPYLRITKAFDAKQVEIRSLNGQWGSSHEWLWYWIDEEQEIPDTQPEIELSLHYQGNTCFTDSSRLKIYEALTAPWLPPERFKLWLHYGPRYRMGKLDELADYMARAGFNTIQSLEGLEFDREMKARGFYLIRQRSGSYHNVYENEFQDCIADGPDWFARQDSTGISEERLRAADATILDFEPGPAGKITEFRDNPWLHDRFKSRNKLPADLELTDKLVKSEYFTEWVDMRQELAAQVVRNWAEYCRSVNPDIATIITQGGVNSFDKTSDVDHLRYVDDVTFIDPMNFTGTEGIRNVKKWMERVPHGQFTGCQNVGAGGYSNLFISDQDMMLHTLGAALIGCKGTSFYPGWALDAGNFVLLNRIMTFLSDHQELIFEGTPDPSNLILAAVPRQDTEIDLGGGATIRNVYPDWDLDATIRGYRHGGRDEYLAVINNRNSGEPCYVELTAALPNGAWYVVDAEQRKLFHLNGEAQISSDDLAEGIYLFSPPSDYRGYRLIPATSKTDSLFGTWETVNLEPIREEALAYPDAEQGVGDLVSQGGFSLGFDDFDRDSKFEYRVEAPGQKIWVSQMGTILKWEIGDIVLDTVGHGLCRDMLWLPSSERSNSDMDAVMKLEQKRVHESGVDLVFRKGVKLASLGGMVSLQVKKTFHFSEVPGQVKVAVTFFNDSLSMDVPSFDLSCRVHNYIDHEERGLSVFWSNDGTRFLTTHDWKMHAMLNMGLSEEEALEAFTRCEIMEMSKPIAFGEYFPHRNVLVAVHPEEPDDILQLLSWRPENSLEPQGTLEWMSRPEALAQGKEVSFAYEISIKTGVEELTAAAIARSNRAAKGNARLLFHLDFENGPDAVVTGGESGNAIVSGDVTYVEAPGGKGIHLPEGASLAYLPEGNIDPRRGKFQIHFKPLWHGGDGETRYFMQLNPRPGFMYFGKLDDSRFLCNMFDIHGKQHWPHSSLGNLEPGGWHTATAAWDTQQGTIQLFLDEKKEAQTRGDPWEMGTLDNRVKDCRLIIGGAPIVIDEIKIWDRP
jgi:hypothetical protein